jgi:hypothetical protein
MVSHAGSCKALPSPLPAQCCLWLPCGWQAVSMYCCAAALYALRSLLPALSAVTAPCCVACLYALVAYVVATEVDRGDAGVATERVRQLQHITQQHQGAAKGWERWRAHMPAPASCQTKACLC